MARAAFRVALCLNAFWGVAATGTDEAACSDGDESCAADETTLLSLRIKQHEQFSFYEFCCWYPKAAPGVDVCQSCTSKQYPCPNPPGVNSICMENFDVCGSQGNGVQCTSPETTLLDVRKDEQHEQKKSGCQAQDHKNSNQGGSEGQCQTKNSWQGCCSQCTGSCKGWTLVYDGAPGGCAKCYLKYSDLPPISEWSDDPNAISGLNPSSSPTPVPPSGCCKWGADCADCGEDGTGWCHESTANCADCGGRFDSSASAPSCETTLLSLRIKQHEQKKSFYEFCCWYPKNATGVDVCQSCTSKQYPCPNPPGVSSTCMENFDWCGSQGNGVQCTSPETTLLDVRKDEQHEQKKSGCQEQDHKNSNQGGSEGQCQTKNSWQGCCSQCTGSCKGWTLVYDGAPGGCAKCYLKYSDLPPISEWSDDPSVISGLNPSSSPTPVPPSGCCKWGADCADCGEDGTGWCHESTANCADCGGRFDSSASAPSCR